MAAHSNFGGLFPQAGILLTAKSNQRALAYCAAAQQDERDGFTHTAAFEWRQAAEAFGWDADEADRCWCNWERLMGLSRVFARAIADEAPALSISDDDPSFMRLAA